jgi:hypothetical protein
MTVTLPGGGFFLKLAVHLEIQAAGFDSEAVWVRILLNIVQLRTQIRTLGLTSHPSSLPVHIFHRWKSFGLPKWVRISALGANITSIPHKVS